MELKKTLLMPKTTFEMRGNLTKKEPLLISKWEKEDLYGKLLTIRSSAQEYAFHDGPPYANGNIHAGHMLNRLLKDFIVRAKVMQGYRVPFIFGFDTHGLPIENMIIKKGVDRKKTPVIEFREKCAAYARSQVKIQLTQIRRLGALGDYEHPYLTLMKEYEAEQVTCFAKMALKGLIYKGLKPVYWSPSSESALAEAEIEYKDVEAHSIYVAFKVWDGKDVVPNDSYALIWTTTPWTLPANLAIAVHPRLVYGLYHTNKGDLLFLEALKERLSEKLSLGEVSLIRTYKGSELEGIITGHPFYDRPSPIILGEHVTGEDGTGLVHTAPGHGLEDYAVGLKYGLKPYCPVDAKGHYDATVGEDLAGLFYLQGDQVVLEKLKKSGALLHHEIIVHAYPHDWRTKKPLIFRATPQWFCSIEKIREKLLSEVEKIRFVPAWGRLRMHNMIKDRADWCISRQRVWGVPLPIIYNEDGSPIIKAEVFDHIVDLIRKDGSDVWFRKEARELLPPGYHDPRSPHDLFTKEKDIMDVWFDSGSSYRAIMQCGGHPFPVDLYLEGSDQYRGWFNSSLTIATACEGQSPYRTCVSHGWVLKEEGHEKMSKSAGGGLDPSRLADTYGADILRLYVAGVDFTEDVRLSGRILDQVGEQYRKIRNTLRFMIGNLSDGEEGAFDPKKDSVPLKEWVDLFIMARLETMKNEALQAYEDFAFPSVLSGIMNFLSADLSSFYLDIAKDVLYCSRKDDPRRRAIQTVIHHSLMTVLALLTPFLPFTCEEAVLALPFPHPEGAMFLPFPKESHVYEPKVLQDYERFLLLRGKVMKALENARLRNVIGSSQEAVITLPDEPLLKELDLDKEPVELARLFIVSEVIIDPACQEPAARLSTRPRCPRCWNHVPELITVKDVAVCPRCGAVLRELADES